MQAKKPDFKIFAGGAEDGELHDFPDVTRGWGVTKLQTNKKPPLSWMNGAFNRVDNNFYYLLQNGLVEWNSELDYYIGALTQVDGVIYRAKEASKGDNPTISAKWERMLSDKVGTSDFIGMSQKSVAVELDKKLDKSSVKSGVGTSTTEVMSQKAVTDALGQPSMTGSATLNGATDNTVVLAGVVTTLGLEVGDVIRIQYSGYDKLHSVESITNNDLIIVNYEHAGNRSNGSLKLADKTATVTITRIAKWYNAPIGLGQAWVEMTSSRNLDVNYTNTTSRPIVFSVTCYAAERAVAIVEGVAVSHVRNGHDSNASIDGTAQAVAPARSTYKAISPGSKGFSRWVELR